jgi:hypothetical protein
MSWLPTRKPSGSLTCLGQVVVGLCCALALLPAGTPALGQTLGSRALAHAIPEGEERPPMEDDEDSEGGSTKTEAKEQEARLLRQRRQGRTSAVAVSWNAHLPHHHAGTPGFSLPVCTPFARGAHLPLRC